jgi:hypothetical protein
MTLMRRATAPPPHMYRSYFAISKLYVITATAGRRTACAHGVWRLIVEKESTRLLIELPKKGHSFTKAR